MESNPILDLEETLGISAQEAIASQRPLLRDAHGPVFLIGFVETSEGVRSVGMVPVVKRTRASIVCWTCAWSDLDPLGAK